MSHPRMSTMRPAAGAVIAAVAMVLPLAAASAQPAPEPVPPSANESQSGTEQAEEAASSVVTDPDAVLGDGWEQSQDRMWAVTGDATGLNVHVATRGEAYAWRTLATLSEPGFDTDRWIANACVTGSGERLAVAYAPRAFVNDAKLAAKGAFIAVVNLADGAVSRVDARGSLAHYSPGCGADEAVVITQETGSDGSATTLLRVDAETASVVGETPLAGQVTSAVADGDDILAVRGTDVVTVDGSGQEAVVARAQGIASRVSVTTTGDVAFLDTTSDGNTVNVVDSSGDVTEVATASVGGTDLLRGTDGSVTVIGRDVALTSSLPVSVERWDVPVGATLSTEGEAAVTAAVTPLDAPPLAGDVSDDALGLPEVLDPSDAEPVAITATVRDSGEELSFEISPEAPGVELGAGEAPAGDGVVLSTPTQQPLTLAAASTTSATVDDPRGCSVPRNDPRMQVYQPTPRQVEWAANQAVFGNLNISRGANWKSSGLPAWRPQTMFPRTALRGPSNSTFRRVPATVLLGVIAQESNMWQATNRAVPGVTGNPLIGNFYGIDTSASAESWQINYAGAAHIVLMGYPQLWQPRLSTVGDDNGMPNYVCPVSRWESPLGPDGNEMRWMDGLATQLNTAIATAVAERKDPRVSFASPTGDFTGGGVCSDTPLINNIRTDRTAGEAANSQIIGIAGLYNETLHPNRLGQSRYAKAYQRHLDNKGILR